MREVEAMLVDANWEQETYMTEVERDDGKSVDPPWLSDPTLPYPSTCVDRPAGEDNCVGMEYDGF